MEDVRRDAPPALPPVYVQSCVLAAYFELDLAGNVRRLRADGGADLGGYRYSAFGKTLEDTVVNDLVPGTGYSRATQPLRWKGRPRVAGTGAGELYDMRARFWSPDLGAFLSIDEYAFHDGHTTLWGWPGQNPYRWSDPFGRYRAPAMDNWFTMVNQEQNLGYSAGAFWALDASAQWSQGNYANAAWSGTLTAATGAYGAFWNVVSIVGPVLPEAGMADACPAGGRPRSLSPPGAGRRGAFAAAKRASGVPVSQQPDRVTPNFDRQGRAQPGRQYIFNEGRPDEVIIRDDAAGHDYGPGDPQNRGPHFNDPAGNHYDY